MEVRLASTDKELDEIETAWNALTEVSPASVFSTFHYVRTAWRHFHAPTDRLYVLSLCDGDRTLGIAPFYITTRKLRGVPCRIVSFIATWGGDRPDIIVAGDKAQAWQRILAFLVERNRDWEILELNEQGIDAASGLDDAARAAFDLHWETRAESVNYFVTLDRSWDDYFASRGGRVRTNWKRQHKRLAALDGGIRIVRITAPEEIEAGLQRYAAIEHASWKEGTRIGVAKDERHFSFYRDVLVQFAGHGDAGIYLLEAAGEAIAGSIVLEHRDVCYGWHTTYAPAFATYSPGVVLHAEILRDMIANGMAEFDFLSIAADAGRQMHKTDWATGSRETMLLTAYRTKMRLLPFVLAKRLKRPNAPAQPRETLNESA